MIKVCIIPPQRLCTAGEEHLEKCVALEHLDLALKQTHQDKNYP